MVLQDAAVEDLVVAINVVSSSIETAGYGERLLCAVFAFKDARGQQDLLHLQLQARLLVPVRARAGRRKRSATRARAAAEGADRRRAADRAGARALVPALGDPDLSPEGRTAASTHAVVIQPTRLAWVKPFSPVSGLPPETPRRLLEGEVARREDQVGLHQLVVGQRLAAGSHELKQRAAELVEPRLVARLGRRHDWLSSWLSRRVGRRSSRY